MRSISWSWRRHHQWNSLQKDARWRSRVEDTDGFTVPPLTTLITHIDWTYLPMDARPSQKASSHENAYMSKRLLSTGRRRLQALTHCRVIWFALWHIQPQDDAGNSSSIRLDIRLTLRNIAWSLSGVTGDDMNDKMELIYYALLTSYCRRDLLRAFDHGCFRRDAYTRYFLII